MCVLWNVGSSPKTTLYSEQIINLSVYKLILWQLCCKKYQFINQFLFRHVKYGNLVWYAFIVWQELSTLLVLTLIIDSGNRFCTVFSSSGVCTTSEAHARTLACLLRTFQSGYEGPRLTSTRDCVQPWLDCLRTLRHFASVSAPSEQLIIYSANCRDLEYFLNRRSYGRLHLATLCGSVVRPVPEGIASTRMWVFFFSLLLIFYSYSTAQQFFFFFFHLFP